MNKENSAATDDRMENKTEEKGRGCWRLLFVEG